MRTLLYFILLAPSIVIGQEGQLPDENRWSIGLNVAPNYTYRKLVARDTFWDHSQAVDSLNLIEKGRTTVSATITLGYKISSRFYLTLGLGISDRGYRSKGFGWNNSYWEGYAVFKQEHFKKDRIYFLDIPLTLGYNLGCEKERKVRSSIFAGPILSSNLHKFKYSSRKFWNGTAMSQYPALEESHFSSLYADPGMVKHLGLVAGARLNTQIVKHLEVNIEPTFKYFMWQYLVAPKEINSASIGWTGVIDRPYSIGLNLALAYTF